MKRAIDEKLNARKFLMQNQLLNGGGVADVQAWIAETLVNSSERVERDDSILSQSQPIARAGRRREGGDEVQREAFDRPHGQGWGMASLNALWQRARWGENPHWHVEVDVAVRRMVCMGQRRRTVKQANDPAANQRGHSPTCGASTVTWW